MTSRDLRPISQLAVKLGVKILAYGGPGTAKTPVMLTAENPCICEIETGLGSIRNHQGPGLLADSPKLIREYVDWACDSTESKQYTHCMDSVSHACKVILSASTRKDGRAAYGDMAETVMDMLVKIERSDRNWFLICKEEVTKGVTEQTRPYFAGQVLPVDTPHLFDCIVRVEFLPYNGQFYHVFRTQDASRTHLVRVRAPLTNQLAEFEPANIKEVMNKLRQ